MRHTNNPAYRIEIFQKTVSGGTGKTVEVKYSRGPLEAQAIAVQAIQNGYSVPCIEVWSDLNEDYIISVSQTELLHGRRMSDQNPEGF